MKNFLPLILFFLAFSPLLKAAPLEEGLSSIRSDTAFYNGKEVNLTGQVSVEHALGKMTAEKALLISNQGGAEQSKKDFQIIQIQDNVQINLRDGGTLTCGSADINYLSLKGLFHGALPAEQVVYTDVRQDRQGLPLFLSLTADEISSLLTKEESKLSHRSNCFIKTLHAQGNIKLLYQKEFSALADRATYHRIQENDSQTTLSKELSGYLFLTPNEVEGVCRLCRGNQDVIDAKKICFDRSEGAIYLDHPKGSLASPIEEFERKIDFSSDFLLWEYTPDLLTLRQNVVVDQKGMGILTTDKEMQIQRYLVNGKSQVKTIQSNGNTALKYSEAATNDLHSLYCVGKSLVNHEHMESSLESPRENGKVPQGKQVLYQDRFGDIYADTIRIKYVEKEGQIQPSHLYLNGNVRIKNTSPFNSSEQSPSILRYTLSDRAEYLPENELLILSSENDNRVLVLDKTNDFQVSAPTITVKRNENSNEAIYKGVGGVRFTLNEKELDQLMLSIDKETSDDPT